MKTCFTAILLVGLQCLASVQAQAATRSLPAASSTAKATASATSGAPVAPSPPSFVNTPGLQVTTPYNGMSIIQDTGLSIAATLAGQRPMSSINISVAKKDGSSNTTIVDIRSGAILRLSQIWNVTAAQYPVGEYIMNMVITPNTTISPLNGTPQAVSSQPIGSFLPSITSIDHSPQPTGLIPGPIPGAGVSVYYWQATVRVIAKVNTPNPTSGATGMQGGIHGYAGVVAAAGVALLGSLLAL
ncbi:hypothetical protein BGZ68_009542 [Mortierella alpina]|nr:hypothetical protein BGZ68_009542 [Mortierella alpina]